MAAIFAAFHGGNCLPGADCGIRHNARSAEQHPGKPVAMGHHISARHKGAHAVPQQKHRQIGVRLLFLGAQNMQIFHQQVPAVLLGKKAEIVRCADRFTMAAEIHPGHENSIFCKKRRKLRITLHVFRHPVGNQ